MISIDVNWYNAEVDRMAQKVRQYYVNRDGTPVDLTQYQAELFTQIFHKMHPRMHIMTPTRWGKSLTIALAVLSRCQAYPEKWSILAGNKDKALIIMDYITQHIFDNQETLERFVMPVGESEDSIRRHRAKDRVTFVVERGKNGKPDLLSEIYVKSADEALGFGAENIIEDEAGLIDDNAHSLVMRMLGDDPRKNFMAKVGNPFNRNHFYKSFKDEAYHKFVITVNDAMAEGRLTKEFLDEMRQQPNFMVLYGDERGPQFPDASAIDESGYSPLITEEELAGAYYQVPHVGELRLGVDVAGEGNDFSSIVLRSDTFAERLFREHTPDILVLTGFIESFAKKHGVMIDDKHVLIDKTGLGDGLCRRMDELYPGNSFGVNAGGSPAISSFYPNEWTTDQQGHQVSNFLNVRAQWGWRMTDWIRRGGKLWPKRAFDDMLDVRYKVQSDKKIKLKSKDEMRKDGAASPDVSDSLALTFAVDPKPRRKPLAPNPWKSSNEYSAL